MKELMRMWLDLKNQEAVLKEAREKVELEMYEGAQEQMKDDKQISIIADEFKLTIKPNFSVKVDQEMASGCPGYFKTKYELSYSEYKKSEHKGTIDEIVTINMIKPSFKVEVK